MSAKKDNLPINIDVDLENGGTITYANEVIAIIAGVAANEIDGIAGMCTSGGFGDILGRNRNITRGVKVEIGSEEASVDLYIVVEYGKPIQRVASEVQDNVRKAIESMTSLHVVRVDVHVQGVSFEKEKKAVQKGIESANIPTLAEPSAAEAKAAEVTDEMNDETMDEVIPEIAAAQDINSSLPQEETLSDVAGAGPEISFAKMDDVHERINVVSDVEAVQTGDSKPIDAPAATEETPPSAPVKKLSRKRNRKL